jgi:uncharacterized protein
VRTDIAGFVGMAERGPLPEDFPADTFDAARVALKISKWGEYLAHFGGFRQYGHLAYAVRAFFENGGASCYVVRAAATKSSDPSQNAAKAMFTLPAAAPLAIGTLSQVTGSFQCAVAAPAVGAVAAAIAGTGAVVSLNAGDLLLISGGGVTQLNHVTAVLTGGQALLAVALDPQLAVGATVSRFPASSRISAASRGNWGNNLLIRITPLDPVTFSLRVTVDLGPNQLPGEDEFYRNLTLADSKSYNYAPAILAKQSNLIRLETLGSSPISLGAAQSLSGGAFYLQGGRDGLAAITLQDFSGGPTDLRGLRLLEEIDDVAILAVPDAVFRTPDVLSIPAPPADPCMPVASTPRAPSAGDPTAVARPLSPQDSVTLQSLMIEQCARLRYRVAVIDPPGALQIEQVQSWALKNGLVESPSSRFAALYYPWLNAPDSLGPEGALRRIPPSGYVAGTYAQTDLTFGVQRPPANLELQFVVDVEQPISDLQQQGLNLNNVNAIRALPGRGIRVWGARSLAGPGDEDWRFIHVRRLMSAIEETAQRSSRWTVFQSNDRALRSSLTHSLNVLLEGIWAKGGLKGTKPADAFYVKCDATNNPQNVIDRGQLVCEIGIAVAAPMEFLVFQIRQDAAGAQVLEN